MSTIRNYLRKIFPQTTLDPPNFRGWERFVTLLVIVPIIILGSVWVMFFKSVAWWGALSIEAGIAVIVPLVATKLFVKLHRNDA